MASFDRSDVREYQGNYHFVDRTFSPAPGYGVFLSCPVLAIAQEPALGFVYYEDFFNYVAADWTVTEYAGNSTQAMDNVEGGVLLFTNGSSDDDGLNFQKVGESFQLQNGKPLWAEYRFKVSLANRSDFMVGLVITNNTALAGVTDGVYFRKVDNTTSVFFVTEKDSTETTSSVHTMASDTWTRMGFWFNGSSSVVPYINGSALTAHTANIPDDEELRVSYTFQNGTASALTMSLDFHKVAQIR